MIERHARDRQSAMFLTSGFLIILLSLLFSCSARPPVKKQEVAELVMETLVIRPQGELLDAQSLFEEGIGAFQGQLFSKCEGHLKSYLEHFSSEIYTHAAHYNLGLCLEFQRKYREAAHHFEQYYQLSKEDSDRLDGAVRLGYNWVFSDRPHDAITLYDELLTTYPLKGFDRAECHLRRAMARLSLSRYAEADRDLSAAISHIYGAIGSQIQGNEALAEVHFQRGEVYRRHMGEIELKLPLSRIKRSIADKTRFFRKSLHAYVSSIKVNHTYWAIAAGHQLGVLHEDIYEDLLNAEYPTDFDDETRAYYFFELDKKLAPLLRESITIYEKTITISATQGAGNTWVQSTKSSLVRLRKIEAELQKRLAMDPLEAYQRKTELPFKREPVIVPLPPTPKDQGETDDHNSRESRDSSERSDRKHNADSNSSAN